MSGNLATTGGNLPAELANSLIEDAQSGDFDKDDFSIPYITILQSLSPELSKSKAEYIEGAKEGLFLNKGTRDLCPDARVIVCKYERRYPVFKPKRGGFVRMETQQYFQEQCAWNADSSSFRTPDGMDIAETRCFYVLSEGSDGSWTPAVISLTGSQAKKAKQWCAAIDNAKMEVEGNLHKAPIYYHIWSLSSRTESNDNGEWFGYVIEKDGTILELGQEALAQAQDFRKGLEANVYNTLDEQHD